MNNFKVCVYAICKNEEKFVDRWVDSMNEADVIVVTDTGSDDNTVKKLQSRGAIVHVEEIKPWRFDTARNISLSHVPDDIDICVCTDLDEIFQSGWRQKLEEAWQKNHSQVDNPVARTGRYLYNWSLKPDGTPGVQFNYFKVHERQGFRWRCPVHEYVQYIGNLPLETIFIDGMVLNHYPDAAKSRNSYLPLLELAVKESPMDDRMCYYLGREYMYKGEWQKCINTLSDYLMLPTATWREERCAAMRWMAKSCSRLNQVKVAYSWYYKAIAEAHHLRDSYVEFSKLCYEQKDWPMSYFLTEEALKIKEKSSTYINMGHSWDHTPDDLCAIAAYRLGMFSKSLEHAKRALEYLPDNKRLKNNLEIIQESANCIK